MLDSYLGLPLATVGTSLPGLFGLRPSQLTQFSFHGRVVSAPQPLPYPATERASAVTAKQRATVEAAAQAVLDARAQYPTSTLADLYDPLAMPAPLLKAHQQLDRAVDRCYRPEPFPSDRHRVEYLFALYEQLTAPLVAAAKPARRRRKQQAEP